MDQPHPKIIGRPVASGDYYAIHRLLTDTVPIAPVGFNWDIRRWEGKRYYDAREGGDPDWHENGHLWQLVEGGIVAMVQLEGPGYAVMQVHPEYRYLEAELIFWAEANLSEPAATGSDRQIHFYAYDYDVRRQRLLADRGYEKMESGGVFRLMRFGRQPLARPVLPAGYSLKTTNPENTADAQRIADLLNAAFNRDFHNVAEYQQFARQAPCFRADLDLVAVAPDGAFAAYVGIPYDEPNRRGIFEPVCTHPLHRKLGLAKCVMQEGLIRLQAAGAQDVVVDTGDMIPANRLYDSLGFDEMYKWYGWHKLVRAR